MVGFQIAGLGGAKFTRSSYETTYYHSLIGKMVGAVHARVNFAEGYGGETLPSFERYFMGGPTSLRGFTIQNIGPKDTNGNPGWRKQIVDSQFGDAISLHQVFARFFVL